MGKFHSIIPEDKKYDQVRRLLEDDDTPQQGGPEGQGSRGRKQARQARRKNREDRSNRSRQTRPNRKGRAGQADRPAYPSKAQRKKSPPFWKGAGVSFWILLVIFIIYAIPTTVSLVRSKSRLGDLQQEEANLNYEKESLKEEVAALQDQLKKVDSDEFIRKYAHEQLGMVLPNEIVIELEGGGLSLDEKAYKKAKDRADELEKRKEKKADLNQKEENPDGMEENTEVNEDGSEAQGQNDLNGQNPNEPAPQEAGDGE